MMRRRVVCIHDGVTEYVLSIDFHVISQASVHWAFTHSIWPGSTHGSFNPTAEWANIFSGSVMGRRWAWLFMFNMLFVLVFSTK